MILQIVSRFTAEVAGLLNRDQADNTLIMGEKQRLLRAKAKLLAELLGDGDAPQLVQSAQDANFF